MEKLFFDIKICYKWLSKNKSCGSECSYISSIIEVWQMSFRIKKNLPIFLLLILLIPIFVMGQEPEDILYEIFLSTNLPESYRQFYNRYKSRLELNKKIKESQNSKSGSKTLWFAEQLTDRNNILSSGLIKEAERRFRIELEGNLISLSVWELVGIVQSPEGDFYICGNGDGKYWGLDGRIKSCWLGVVVKIDNIGRKIWQRIYRDITDFVEITGITVDDESNVYLSVHTGPIGEEKEKIVKYDKNGNLKSEVVLPIELMWSPIIRGVIYSDDGSIICAYDRWIEGGDFYLSRGVCAGYYDKHLNFILTRVVLNDSYVNENAFGGIVKDRLGNVYIGGASISSLAHFGRYFVTDLIGNTKYYDFMREEGRVEMKITGLPTGVGILGSEMGSDNRSQMIVINSSEITWKRILKPRPYIFYSGFSADSLGNIYIGGYTDNYYAMVIKLDSLNGNRRSEIVYDKGYGADLVFIDSLDKINVIGWGEDVNELFFVRYKVEDTIPPSAIRDLSIYKCSEDSIQLTFTAPGDDEDIGQAVSYDIRYSKEPILTDEDFYYSAEKVEDVPVLGAAGTKEIITINNLEPDTQYYFAIKAIDDACNISDISNCVSGRTTGWDSEPPSAITDLSVLDCSTGSVTLSWSASGDDGNEGDILGGKYIIVYDKNYPFSTNQIVISTDTKPGNKETFTVGGLEPGEQYYFALKTVDDAGNESKLSNVVSARTLLDVPYFNQHDVPWGGDLYDKTTFYFTRKGCAVTSLAMVINYYAKLLNKPQIMTDPGKLNRWLTENDGYEIWRDATDGKLKANVIWKMIYKFTDKLVAFDSLIEGRNDKLLNEDLINKMPVILAVNDNKHFVVCTGSTPLRGYTINDPDSRALTELRFYAGNYSGLRRFKPGPVDVSNLLVYAHSPVEISVVDSEGNKTGFDKSLGKVEQIPNSVYTWETEYILEEEEEWYTPYPYPFHKMKIIDIGRPSTGYYTLNVLGIDDGEYKVSVYCFDYDGGMTKKEFLGKISKGEIRNIFINYTPSPQERSEIFEDSTPPVTEIVIEGAKFVFKDVTYITPSSLIKFESTDPVVGEGASGVKYTEYRIDGSSWTVYKVPFTITQEGQHTIEYRSVDNVGNVEWVKKNDLFVNLVCEYALVGADKIKLTGKIDVDGNIRSNNKIYLTGYV